MKLTIKEIDQRIQKTICKYPHYKNLCEYDFYPEDKRYLSRLNKLKQKITERGSVMKCLDCGCDEGTLLKEFQENPEENYSWHDLAMMTEVCVSCGSENIETEKV